MMEPQIPLIVSRIIAAPCSRIFAAFADPSALARWFKPNRDTPVEILTYEFRIGGTYRLAWLLPDGRRPVVRGTFEEIERDQAIRMTWVWEAPDPLAGVPMRVTFHFEQSGGATEVKIVHEGIPNDMACTVHQEGWESTLDVLTDVLIEGPAT
ncbi:SRPBCC domain-containing protein [uncultured Roseibium sp.]|uniref:SRPBCC family protein n=1 Tax=uncultured Roseibium sp. TaxID=1936171 RepID=UPI0026376BF6|nr:SRPBCC domain-containing protein [uncultured Roseibium sp.]